MIINYPSVAALRADCIAMAAKKGYYGFGGGDWGGNSWYGGETKEQTLSWSETGKTDLVPLAQKVMDQLDSQIETPRRSWEPALAGSFPSVPDFLSGHPLSMRRRITVANEGSPISIVAITSSSGGVDSATLTKRGVAVLALTMALARVRPVNLRVADIGDGVDKAKETIVTASINTAPLDLATACYCLTSTGFTRRLLYTVCHNKNGSYGGWPPGYYNYHNLSSMRDSHNKYIDSLYAKLGLDPNFSLIIDATRLNDPIVKDPIKWVNMQVARFLKTQEEAFSQ